MAQLSQDYFASGAEIFSVDEAVEAITARFGPVDGVDTVPLRDADGRVLVADLIATLQLPPFTNSAVDGYAVRGEDVPTSAAQPFRVAGRLLAGGPAMGRPVAHGEAIRIFTGAPMPEGADTVFMQEDVSVDEAGREGDYVKTAVESVGSLVFWRVAMKPGRPIAMGVIDGRPFIGLPGNPVASFVTFARVARPAILALAGTQWSPPPGFPCERSSLIVRNPRAGSTCTSICAGPRTARSRLSNFRARGLDCYPRSWIPTAWSSSPRTSHRSNLEGW